MKVKMFPSSEVAYMLRLALGPMREWSDALTDMRRDKTDIDGLRLLPTCRLYDGRSWRPGYTAAAIKEFITEIRVRHPEIKAREPIRGFEVDLDPLDDRSWVVRKIAPVTIH